MGTAIRVSGLSDILDVVDGNARYGLRGNDSTDNTGAFADLMADAASRKGLNCYLHDGIYLVSGAPSGTANAQISLPDVPWTASGEQLTVRLFGATPPSMLSWIPEADTVTPTEARVIIRTSYNAVALPAPALFGGKSATEATWTPGIFHTMVYFILENIEIRCAPNPAIVVIDASTIAALDLRSVSINQGVLASQAIVQPTHTGSYGIKLPGRGNNGGTHLERVQVMGHYTGIQNGEHVHAGTVWLIANYIGMESIQTDYPSQWSHLLLHRNRTELLFSGTHPIFVGAAAIEDTGSGWAAIAYDVDDASNYAHGLLQYVTTGGGLSVNGATNLTRVNLAA